MRMSTIAIRTVVALGANNFTHAASKFVVG